MGLTCFCDDDYDSYYENGGAYDHSKHGDCKCEACDAPLGAGDDGFRFIVMSPDDSSEFPPIPQTEPDWLGPEPECNDQYRHWCQALEAAEQDRDDWIDATGWDDDRECHMTTSYVYLCERCDGLYQALHGDLGYCSVTPWSLIDDHREYVRETTGRRMNWARDQSGVLQPVRRAAA